MKFQIGELKFEVTPRSFKVEGFIEKTEFKLLITHQLFSGDTTSIELKVAELEITGKI